MTSDKPGWRSPLIGAGLAILVFGCLGALFLALPPGSRFFEARLELASVSAAIGLFSAIVAVWFLRPGSSYLARLAALDQELMRLAGEPATLFVGTATFSNLSAVPEVSQIRNGRLSLWQCAVGPHGVAIGRPGKTSRCVLVADRDDPVKVEVGGPGGGPMKWRTEITPQLHMHIARPQGDVTITWDMLVSPSNARSVRDVGEVHELVAQLTAALSTRHIEPPA